ncbi:unnamed protein product [Owenia fusiformis]|uniref:Uncharacterized protein n=1 Tax=Owenia fusiformis TaxID=6347 RepID=A0A8J1TW05_OWEFU|nr:unnamed protein product [Owenia fusiformis]
MERLIAFILLCVLPCYTKAQTVSCMDLLFAVDTSCSVTQDQLDIVRDTMFEIVDRTEFRVSGNRNLVAGLTYSKGSQHEFFFDTYDSKADVLTAIRNFNMTPAGCRTHTFNALKVIQENYYDLMMHGSRAEFRDVIVVFTDGMTYPNRKQKKTKEYAAMLKAMNPGVKVFVVQLDNIENNDGLDEFRMIASDPFSDHNVLLEDAEQAAEDLFSLLPKDCVEEEIKCEAVVDVVLVMDRSNSIEIDDLKLLVDFFRELASQFDIDTNVARFAAISYNNAVYKHFPLSGPTAHHDRRSTINWIVEGIPLTTDKNTRTDLALVNATEILDTEGREGVRKIIFLATDGNTIKAKHAPDTIEAAKAAKRKGYQIFCVGLPNNNGRTNGIDEWRQVASKPLATHLFTDLEDFASLRNIVADLTQSACAGVFETEE